MMRFGWKIALALIFAAATFFMNTHVQDKPRKSLPIPPAPELAQFHLGYAPVIADAYWLRFLQDIEFCGVETPVPIEKTKAPDGRRMGPNRTPSCHMGWAYHMLNLILDLDPRFHIAARLGPLSLSVVADDIEGATRIFQKSTTLFPADWQMNYQAGYHWMLELENKEKATEFFRRSHQNGGPKWLPLLIARLETEAGKTWLAKSTLNSFLNQVQDDDRLRNRALEKLKALDNFEP